MRFKIHLQLALEILVRLVLWCLFKWLNHWAAFHRHIAPEELWMYKYPPPDGDYVSSRNLWIMTATFPLTIFGLEFLVRGLTNDIITGISAITLAYGLNGFITAYLKVIVGRPRPDFYFRCFPDGVGSDVTQCTGPAVDVKDGWKSFPSGHSSFAFTCMVFMACYIARKLSLWRATTGQSWRLCAVILPLLVAASIAISRTCDYHHHFSDVIGGSLIGTTIAGVVYWLYFPVKSNQEQIGCNEQ